jgi:DNA replication protein DnaC
MTPSDLTRLDAQLQRLQLHHIQSHYQALATKAAEQQSSHLDYLEQLVEGEARCARTAASSGGSRTRASP